MGKWRKGDVAVLQVSTPLALRVWAVPLRRFERKMFLK
jgi:hypothetical protein